MQVRINSGGKIAKCAPLTPRVGTVQTLRLLRAGLSSHTLPIEAGKVTFFKKYKIM